MTVTQLLDAIIGPFGAIVVLAIGAYIGVRVVSELWADHKRGDADDREQRDAAIARLAAMVTALDRNTDAIESTAASVEQLAKAFSEYIAEQAKRQRRGTDRRP